MEYKSFRALAGLPTKPGSITVTSKPPDPRTPTVDDEPWEACGNNTCARCALWMGADRELKSGYCMEHDAATWPTEGCPQWVNAFPRRTYAANPRIHVRKTRDHQVIRYR